MIWISTNQVGHLCELQDASELMEGGEGSACSRFQELRNSSGGRHDKPRCFAKLAAYEACSGSDELI